MRYARGVLVGLGTMLAVTGTASASSLSISASPGTIPAAGAVVSVGETGHADRDGQLIVYVQHATSSCQPTSADERIGPDGQGRVGADLNNKLNVVAGEDLQESAQFSASPGISYRICGYLSGDDDTVPPDAKADALVCTSGTHVSGRACVDDAPPAADPTVRRLKIRAPSKASGRISVTLQWTALGSDHNVFLYAQPSSVRCAGSGSNERIHRERGIRTVYAKIFNEPGVFKKTLSVKEARGGRTRLCAYLVGFDDLGAPHLKASAVVG